MRPLRQASNAFRTWRRRRRYRTAAARIRTTSPVIVHSHGKVGSSTITAALKQTLDPGTPVFHTHNLSEEGRTKAAHKFEGRRGDVPHLLQSEALAPYLDRLPEPTYVVTLTRDPVARAISHVFESIADWAPPAYREMSPEELARLAIGRVDALLQPDNHVADPAQWFDREVRGVFGIDVFERPYDEERGYVRYDRGPVRLLVMRMEDLDRAAQQGLADLLGRPAPDPTAQRQNVGDRKWYAAALREVRRIYRPSAEQVERVLEGRYYRHFYGSNLARA